MTLLIGGLSYHGRTNIVILICMLIYLIVEISEYKNVECSKDSLRNTNVNTLSVICSSCQIAIDTKCSQYTVTIILIRQIKE